MDNPGERVWAHRFATGTAQGLVRRHVPPAEFDRHDPQHVFPVRLVPEDLAQLRLGRFPRQEKVQRLVKTLGTRERVDLRRGFSRRAHGFT